MIAIVSNNIKLGNKQPFVSILEKMNLLQEIRLTKTIKAHDETTTHLCNYFKD